MNSLTHLEEQDLLYQAQAFLEQGHVKAAAVYVRSKFELVLKSTLCPAWIICQI